MEQLKKEEGKKETEGVQAVEVDAADQAATVAAADPAEKKKKGMLFYGILLIIVAACWGAGNPALKIAVENTSPLYCLSMRFLIAFVLFIIPYGKYVVTHFKKEHIMPIAILSFMVSMAYITCSYGMMFTTATNAGFFMSTSVVFVPIISYFALKTRLNRKLLLPIAVVVVGIYFLSTSSGEIKLNPGDLMAMSSAVFTAAMFVFTAKYVRQMETMLVVITQIGFCAVWCLAGAVLFEDFPDLAAVSTEGWLALLFVAIICTCVAFVIQNMSLKHVSPEYVSIIFTSEPIFGAVTSYFLLGEGLSMRGVLGAGLILVSIVVASVLSDSE